jgi:hypothetical protein
MTSDAKYAAFSGHFTIFPHNAFVVVAFPDANLHCERCGAGLFASLRPHRKIDRPGSRPD